MDFVALTICSYSWNKAFFLAVIERLKTIVIAPASPVMKRKTFAKSQIEVKLGHTMDAAAGITRQSTLICVKATDNKTEVHIT